MKGEQVDQFRTRGRRLAAAAAGAIVAAFGLAGIGATLPTAVAAEPDSVIGSTARPDRTPLSNPVVTAMLVQGHPSQSVDTAQGPEVQPDESSDREAAQLLQTATESVPESLAGEHVVYLREEPDEPFQTVSAVTANAPGGTQVTFADRSTKTFVPHPSRAGVDGFAEYTKWSSAPGDMVAGRQTTQLTAHKGDAVSARYWIDTRTRAVLWQQTYHPDGQLLGSAGFTSLDGADNDTEPVVKGQGR